MAEPVSAVGSPNAAEVAAAPPTAPAAAQLASRLAAFPSPSLPADSEATAEDALYDREAQLAADGAPRARLLLPAGRLHAEQLGDPPPALQRYRDALAAD